MVTGSAQSFSSVRLTSGSHRQTQMQLDSWTPGQGAWHDRDMLGVAYMCCVIRALLCNMAGTYWKPKGQMKIWVHFVLLLYQPTHHGVSPSWWGWCDRRGSGGLCLVGHLCCSCFPGWVSCSCSAWHGISQAQTWETRHMLGGRVAGLWLWNFPIWSTAVSVLERSDLNFTQYSSDVWPAHPSLLETPHVFLNCACLPLLPLSRGLY